MRQLDMFRAALFTSSLPLHISIHGTAHDEVRQGFRKLQQTNKSKVAAKAVY